jgi:hypothetical protein
MFVPYRALENVLDDNPQSSSTLSGIDAQKKTLITYHNLLRIK